jgi:hypothetical protein
LPLTSTRRSSARQRGAPGAFTARRTLSLTSMCGPPHDMPYHERVGRPIGNTRPLAPRHRGAGDQNSGKGTGLWAYTQGGHPLTAWRGNVQGRTHGAIAPAGPIFLHGPATLSLARLLRELHSTCWRIPLPLQATVGHLRLLTPCIARCISQAVL